MVGEGTPRRMTNPFPPKSKNLAQEKILVLDKARAGKALQPLEKRFGPACLSVLPLAELMKLNKSGKIEGIPKCSLNWLVSLVTDDQRAPNLVDFLERLCKLLEGSLDVQSAMYPFKADFDGAKFTDQLRDFRKANHLPASYNLQFDIDLPTASKLSLDSVVAGSIAG
ncbi:hypothetical protein NKR23_g10509 [Pleurostoma richardsiae]|uniref:Uncharacterized protein n=1 Tax=Pleurostoma richardsiae TaxID=41990 RepID=A0AA38VLF9_9PEZI|nr:hypothetical protein NKR23_g10509 [Pleurostoma richardsiae]